MKKDELRFIKLGWTILEAKYFYYCLDGNPRDMPDQRYDALEMEYIKLAKKLKKEPTASNMVGFDQSRPSCRLVIGRISKKNFTFTVDIRHEETEK